MILREIKPCGLGLNLRPNYRGVDSLSAGSPNSVQQIIDMSAVDVGVKYRHTSCHSANLFPSHRLQAENIDRKSDLSRFLTPLP
jgi:hypothetical protein